MPTFLHAPTLIITLHCPFHQAAPGTPPLCSASYVLRGATQSSHMNRTPPQLSSMMENQLGQNLSTNLCTPMTTVTSASTGISRVTMPTATTPRVTIFTSIPSAEKPTQHYPRPVTATPQTLEDFLLTAQPPLLQYSNFTNSIVPCPPFDPSTHLHQDIFNRIHHPYNTNAFESSLSKFNLTDRYPQLIQNLCYGFPLGNMPSLLKTVILPNPPSCLDYLNTIDEYLASKVES